jgi:putative tryptophan/tyrosine transport system substrate-binding protein
VRICGRRSFLTSVAVIAGIGPVARIEGHEIRVHRIGLVVGDDPEGGGTAFRETLRRLGYYEGRNLHIETRSGSAAANTGNPAAELARLDLELLVVISLPNALAARAENINMPLVVVTTPGFVSNGFAESLERPGGNVTGIDELPPGVTAKRLTLLKTAAPAVSRIALLSTTPGKGGHETQLKEAEATASKLGVAVKAYRATSLPELKAALAHIAADDMEGLLNFQGGLSFVHRQLIIDFAAARRIPAIYQATVFASSGGLMTWAPDLVEQYRLAARYADKILRGTKPGDLPIQFPPKYYLTINTATAKRLNLELPQSLIAQADRTL